MERALLDTLSTIESAEEAIEEIAALETSIKDLDKAVISGVFTH